MNKTLLESKSKYQVINHSTGAQHKNLVESKISIGRKIFRSLFRCYKNEQKTVTSLDFYQLSYLCHMISLSVNSIPYCSGGIFSPAYLKHNSGLIELFEGEIDTFSQNEPANIQKLKDHALKLREIRNEVLASVALSDRNLSGHQYELRSGCKRSVSKGDICLYCPSSIKRGQLARVIEPNKSNSTRVLIRLASRTEHVEIKYLFLIVPAKSGLKFNEKFSSPEVSRLLKE